MRNGELEFEKIHEAFRPKILRYLTRLVGPYEGTPAATPSRKACSPRRAMSRSM